MKKKINVQFMIIASLAILFTLGLVIGTFYELFKDQVFEDLKTYTYILKSMAEQENAEENTYCKVDNLRITVIEKDGVVVYDGYRRNG